MTVARRLMGAVAVAVVVARAAPAAARDDVLLVSVAISMKDAVEEIGRLFVQARPRVTVRYNFGASGDLQKQIEAGAPVDVFVSAAERQMDELERKGLIDVPTRRTFAKNVLVVVTPTESALHLTRPADLLDPRVRKIAVGNPKTVPVGQYSEESLRGLGVWERLRPKLVFTENVRQALDYVARGEVDAGFVYATDAALRADRVTEAFRPAEDTYRAITYPVAVVKDARGPALARAFVALLAGPAARPVLARFGFRPPPPAVDEASMKRDARNVQSTRGP